MSARQPARGDETAYARYLSAMDAAMAQKIALTAAHLLGRGVVADMGMGSGTGSEALAALYPELAVVGVDLDPEMVERARARFHRNNLSFVVGNVAEPVFPAGSLDAIFDSSVLHHVTTFSGYDHQAAGRALRAQAAQLKDHGVLIVRDFLDPGPGLVWLDLPSDDGSHDRDPRTASSADLFRRFAGEYRPLSAQPGFVYRELVGGPELRPGWRRFELEAKLAAEFLLRKDYREDWEREVQEEYTYFTREEMERCFEELGLRVLASTPLLNPWIVRHRWAGKAELRQADGAPRELPPTNYVIAGERVPPGEGVRFRLKGLREPLGFLEQTYYLEPGRDRVMDLIRRPHRTLDFLPFFEDQGALFVLARRSYPRPILALSGTLGPGARIAPLLGGVRAPHYVTEPLNVLEDDKPPAQTIEEALQLRAGLPPESIRRFYSGLTYYPSPGGVQEEVSSTWVEIVPAYVSEPLAGISGFASSGRVGAIDAEQVVRAAQVGGLPDARLELNVYGLLARLGRSCGPWIGEAITLSEASVAPRASALGEEPPRRAFRRTTAPAEPGFLSLICAELEEVAADGSALASRPLELALPRRLSTNTVVVAPLWRSGGEVWFGLEERDLPAVQCFEGRSNLFVAPAWRLPWGVESLTPAREFLKQRLLADHGARAKEMWLLGGHYHPSPGVTPEAVFPFAVEIVGEEASTAPLRWVRLAEALAHPLRDGHLRVVLHRAAHALGLL